MNKNLAIIILSVVVSSFVTPSIASTEIADRIAFSGFGRLVGGYLDEENASYEGYSNKLSFTQQSLFALQSDVTLTEKLSLSAQLLAHSSDERESGIEWLYLNYEPNQNWRFKVGKLRTPFFRYSDVIDVGFAYPWLTPPQQVYSGFLFSNYEGATGTYRFDLADLNFEVEGYYGKYEGNLARTDNTVEITVDKIIGTVFSLNSGNLNMRISAIQSTDFFADVPEFALFANILENAGFKQNAESLRFKGTTRSYQASINYDTIDYYVAAEWVRITSDILIIPELDSYYLSAGYNFHPFQAHITYSISESSYDTQENLIPKGVSEQLDQLSFSYDQITSDLPNYPLNSTTVGIRWDFRHNMSAKAEVTFLDGKPGENSFFAEISDANFDRKATLCQFGLEWIF